MKNSNENGNKGDEVTEGTQRRRGGCEAITGKSRINLKQLNKKTKKLTRSCFDSHFFYALKLNIIVPPKSDAAAE